MAKTVLNGVSVVKNHNRTYRLVDEQGFVLQDDILTMKRAREIAAERKELALLAQAASAEANDTYEAYKEIRDVHARAMRIDA